MAAPPQANSSASDPVADLIAKVEKDYQSGLADYQAGNHEAAKQDFDRAFNALLGSNLDVRSDERLAKEFERVVAGVNRLDMGNLTDNGLGGQADSAGAHDTDTHDAESHEAEGQQKSEPAPIDETNEIAPSADANVKAKAQAEIKSTRSDLPLMMTDQVAGYISYFSNRLSRSRPPITIAGRSRRDRTFSSPTSAPARAISRFWKPGRAPIRAGPRSRS